MITITSRIIVTGVVQGVGFRPFIYRLAKDNNLTGYVANKGSFVEIIVQGLEKNIKKINEDIIKKKPPLAVINIIEIENLSISSPKYENFVISKSDVDFTKTISYIPSDVSICDQCLEDMYKGDRKERYHYPFTSCVDCGPRFTVIKSLPYDRPSTTMDEFPLCEKCTKEYTDPLDRRYHAQTTCCRECGPRYTVYNNIGEKLDYKNGNLIDFVSQQLNAGKVIAIKGIGGTHIACSVNLSEPIEKIRQTKGDRKRKPFAVMSLSLDSIRQFAEIPNLQIEKLLLSVKRPIVLLPKKESFPIQEEIAPSLHNIGVMMPYAGIHYLLLNKVDHQTLVMTSANRSHEPIQIDNNEIMNDLNEIADYFLLHDREIYQRADDSVIKPLFLTSNVLNKEVNLFIRKSRGYVPEPLDCPKWKKETTVIGVSSELHTSGSVVINQKMFLTQFIGNLGYEKTLRFLDLSLKNLLSILQQPSIETVVSDLHPSYISTGYAKELNNTNKSELYQIQHHFSHASALLGENLVFDEPAVIFVGDGLGYGEDGNIWGGEFVKGTVGNLERISHWEYVQQPGGDLATKYPVRMIISYLYKLDKSLDEVTKFVMGINKDLITEDEINIVYSQCKKKINSPLTSSTGRFLDAVAVALGLISDTSYEGEPAIILESHAMRRSKHFENTIGNPLLENYGESIYSENLSLLFNAVLNTLNDNRDTYFIAYWVHYSLAMIMAIKCESIAKKDEKIKYLGFTGGTAYNDLISSIFYKTVIKFGYKPLIHNKLPPGDGGISAGQCYHYIYSNKSK
ncbi:MAG: carbamoyltransferase HypF [Candidatus Hodarchaeales archaeon]